MNCLVISESASFPWGMASSTRVSNICKALIDQGCDVSYIGLRGATTPYNKDKLPTGKIDDIIYWYPGGFAVRSSNWLLRRLDDLTGKWLSVAKVFSLRRQQSIDVVILYSRNPNVVKFWSRICKLQNIKTILEVCEWPVANYTGKNIPAVAKEFCERSIFAVDAIIPISDFIEKEVHKVLEQHNSTIPTFKIPILYDTCKLSHDRPMRKDSQNYILYSGSILYLDISYMIIDIIFELHKQNHNLKLKFTGGGYPENFHKVKEYVQQKKLEEQIEFTGFVPEDVLFTYMTQALCLLAPLPDTKQSRARFPTKIGYYLSSATPIVTNQTGSVGEYLSDQKNAYLAEHFNAESLADKVIDVIGNSQKAGKVGKRGKELAYKNFYYKKACAGLRDFIEEL